MKARSSFILFPSLVLALVLVFGCESESSLDPVVMAVANGPANLDPRFATDATSERINRLLYSRLVEFDAQYLPVPSLAEWKQVSPRQFRFLLLPDLSGFSNGQVLSANDVLQTYKYVLNPENLSPHRKALENISNIASPDEQTVDFYLTEPDPLFPARLSIGILPATLILSDHDFNRHPVGNGPFQLIGEYNQQKTQLLRRSDNQVIEIIQVKDPLVRVLKLLNDEVDLLQNDLPPELAGYLKKQKIQYLSHPGTNFTYLGIKMTDPVLAQQKIRNAISHAINREEIIKYVFNHSARLAESILPASHWAGSDKLDKIIHDPEYSRELLAEFGYDLNNPLKLSYKTSTDPFRIKLATILQHQLLAVGIKLSIESYDWGTFFGDIKAGRFQLYSLSWVGINTPDIFRYVFHSGSLPPEGANRGRYDSEQVDRLLESVVSLDSLDKQKSLFHLIQAIIHRDLPYIPLWYEDQQAFFSHRIRGYQLSSDGNYDALTGVKIVRN